MSEESIEKEIQDRGLEAPRLTPDYINSCINSCMDKIQYHVFDGSCLTVCCLTLLNGYTVTGISACASPENFDKELGEKVSFEKARKEIWALEGYLLKERLFRKNK